MNTTPDQHLAALNRFSLWLENSSWANSYNSALVFSVDDYIQTLEPGSDDRAPLKDFALWAQSQPNDEQHLVRSRLSTIIDGYIAHISINT